MIEQIEKLIIAYEKQLNELKVYKSLEGKFLTTDELVTLIIRIADKVGTIQDLKKLLRYSE